MSHIYLGGLFRIQDAGIDNQPHKRNVKGNVEEGLRQMTMGRIPS